MIKYILAALAVMVTFNVQAAEANERDKYFAKACYNHYKTQKIGLFSNKTVENTYSYWSAETIKFDDNGWTQWEEYIGIRVTIVEPWGAKEKVKFTCKINTHNNSVSDGVKPFDSDGTWEYWETRGGRY